MSDGSGSQGSSESNMRLSNMKKVRRWSAFLNPGEISTCEGEL